MPFDLELSDEQRALKQMLREFAAEVLRPAARDAEEKGATPDGILAQIHEIGVAAPIDEAYGGGGMLDAVTYCMAAEELAWGDPGIAHHALSSGLAAIVLGLAGDEDQKKRHLPGFAGVEPPRSFVAVGEKIAAGDLGSLATTIDGDKVVGDKYGVLDADDARLGIVVGRSAAGLAAVIVSSDHYEMVRPERKLGLQAAPTSVVRFDGVGSALPAGPQLDRAILWTKLALGAVAVGSARACLEYASDYAIDRTAFGKPIGAFQGISFKIADMATEVDSARLAVWKAAWEIDRGTAAYANVAEALGQALAVAVRCGDDGVQILGGHGYVKDHPVEKWFRDAVTLSVFDPPDLLGDAIVARSVLA